MPQQISADTLPCKTKRVEKKHNNIVKLMGTYIQKISSKLADIMLTENPQFHLLGQYSTVTWDAESQSFF